MWGSDSVEGALASVLAVGLCVLSCKGDCNLVQSVFSVGTLKKNALVFRGEENLRPLLGSEPEP